MPKSPSAKPTKIATNKKFFKEKKASKVFLNGEPTSLL